MFRSLLLSLNAILFLGVNAQENVIEERISMIQANVPLEYNDMVHSLVIQYVENQNDVTSTTLERFYRYESFLDSAFNAIGIPNELKYLSIALSECKSTNSYLGTRSGWFNMTESVAKKHNLVVGRYLDERRDPRLAALAFAHEMKELNSEYQNWKTTILVYLTSHDKWQASKDRGIMEYSHYVSYSQFVAATYIGFFHESHKINPSNIYPKTTISVPISELTTIYQVSSSLKVDYALLKELNAKYLREIIPNTNSAFLSIPTSKLSDFRSMGEKLYEYTSIPTYNATEVKFVGTSMPMTQPKPIRKKPVEVVEEKIEKEIEEENRIVDVTYHVKDGDILSRIADYYDCSLKDLKAWNNLSSDWLNIDQLLVIKVPAKKSSYYRKIDYMTKEEKRRLAALD